VIADATGVQQSAAVVEADVQGARVDDIPGLQSDFATLESDESTAADYPVGAPTSSTVAAGISNAQTAISTALSTANGAIGQANGYVAAAIQVFNQANAAGNCNLASPTPPAGMTLSPSGSGARTSSATSSRTSVPLRCRTAEPRPRPGPRWGGSAKRTPRDVAELRGVGASSDGLARSGSIVSLFWSPRRWCRSRRSDRGGPGQPPCRSSSSPRRRAWWPSRTGRGAGVLLEVLGLEVVGPQHPQVMLDQIGPLLFDDDGPLLEDRVVRAVELLHARLHRSASILAWAGS